MTKMEIRLFFILALVPVGVFCSSAAANPITTTAAHSALEYALAEDDEPDDKEKTLEPLFTDLRNLTDADATKYFNSKCHDLNRNDTTNGAVYVNTMEQEGDSDGSSKRIEGPHGKAHQISKSKTIEKRFHKPCPANPAECIGGTTDGYTIAMWFSILSDNPEWAAEWPGNCRTTLVSINNHIVITSRTMKAEQLLHEVQIDLNPSDKEKNLSLSLSNKGSYLMQGNINVCEKQTKGTNCTGKDEEQIEVGWQWNHLAVVVKKISTTHKVRLYWNGNAVPRNNISEDATPVSSTVDGEQGVILNAPLGKDVRGECGDVGFDNFGMWERPLTHGEILQLHSADFCDKTTTKSPPKPLGEVIDTTNIPDENEIKELVKNATLVKQEVGRVNTAFTKLNASADEVKPDELKKYFDDTLDLIDTLAKSEDVFKTPEGGDKTHTTDFAEQFVGVLGAALDVTDKSILEAKDKGDVTKKVVDTCAVLTKSLLASGTDTPVVGGDIAIEFYETTPVSNDEKGKPAAIIGGVEIQSSAFTEGKSTKIAVLTLKYEAIKHMPVTVSSKENQVKVEVAGDIKVILMDKSDDVGRVTFTEPIVITNTIKNYNKKLPVANCVYMESDNTWATEGVKTKQKEENGHLTVVCSTTHLTNFAVLMSVTPIKISESHQRSLSTLSIVCISISLIALFIGIVILFVFRELRGTRISILKHLSISMFIAQLMFVTAIEKAAYNTKLCLVIAVFIHYLWLSVFFWMLAQGIFLYMKLRLAVRSDANIVWFCLIGWGFPAVMVTVTAGINIEAYGSEDLCWLDLEGGGAWAFVGPVIAICLVNCVVIVMAMKAFTSVKSFKDKDEKEKFKSTLKAMVVMLPLLGLSWFFGVFANIPGAGLAFMYIFALCNGLQGLFLFIFHIVFNAEVQRVVKRAILKRSGSVGSEEPSFIRKMMGPESGVTQTSDFGKSTM